MQDGPSTLVVDDGERLHRLAPLPVPAGNNGLLRLAYTAPLAVLEGHTTFALELPDGSVLGLPAPTKRLARHELEQRLQAESDRRAGAEERVAERDAALEEAHERLVTASRALAEEQARASAELEQASAAAVQAEQRALEHERARTDAEEQSRASQAEMHRHADSQRLAEARLAAAIEGREAAEARTDEIQQAHLILQRRLEELDRVKAENEQRVTAVIAEPEEAQTTAAELATPTPQRAAAGAERNDRRPEWKAAVTPMILLRARRVSRVSVLGIVLLVMLLVEVALTLTAK